MKRPDIDQLRRLEQLHEQLARSCTLFDQIVGELEIGRAEQWRQVQSRVTLLGNRLAGVVDTAQTVMLEAEQLRREIRRERIVA